MAKKTVSNGIFEKDGQFYMMCGDKNVKINIVTTSGVRLISKELKRTPVVAPKRTPV